MTSRSSCKSQGPRQRPAIVEGESYHSSCSSSGIVLGGKGGSGSNNPVDKGGGSSGKRGLAGFSLRRLLYSSPLVGRRSGGVNSRGGGMRGEGGMFALGALGQTSRQQFQQALAAVVGGSGLGGDGLGNSDGKKRKVDVEKGSAGTRHSGKGAEARWGKPSRATRVSSSRKDAKSKTPSGAKSKGVSLVEDTSSVLQVEDEELGCVMVEVSLNSEAVDSREFECPLCLSNYPPEYFPTLGTCMHRSCYDCFQRYLRIEISASRVAVACPQCSEPMHPNDIRMILNDRALYEKYEDFMVRRVLAVDPDTRWCPAPDCGFAVIASGCASCPRLKCERPGCGAHFCYHCRAPWHPDQTCDAARLERSQSPSYLHFHPHHHHSHHHHHSANNPSTTSSAAPSSSSAASSSSGASSSHGPGPIPNSSSTSSHHRVHSSSSASFGMGDSERGHHSHHHHRDDIKPCPRCQVLIVKMDDGSCNHMTCAVCGAEFCWLCMKLISDLHYLSPSGCTFWGKKPWSRKKKILWQLGTLVGAPVGIGLLAGIAVPAMIIGIPVWVGRKLYARYEQSNRHRRNLAIAGGVTASVVVSPILAGLAVGIGVPILLFYVYGVVPVSLCRSGGCGVSTSPAGGVRFDFDEGDGGVVGVGGLGGGMSGPQTPGGDGSSTHGLLGRSGAGDTASVDTSIHHGVVGGGGVGVGVGAVGNPSIGEASLSLGSGSQLERLGRDDEEDEEEVRQGGESGSNAALAGASLAGSIASSLLPGGQRLEVQADVAAGGSCSVSSSGRGSAGEGAMGGDAGSREGGVITGVGGQRLSVSSSGTVGSCASGGVILGGVGGEKDDKCLSSKSSSAVDEGSSTGGASTRALAGSITLNFKATDSSSLYHFRESPEEDWSLDGGGVSEGEGICGPGNPTECVIPRGHGMHRRNHPTPTSHPMGSARKCTGRRVPMDREGSDSSSWTGGEDGASSDRVRFDDHVRFIGGANVCSGRQDTPSPLAQVSTPSHPLRSSSLSLQHAPSGGVGSGLASSASSGPALGAATRRSGPHLPWSRSQSVGEMPVPSTSLGTATLQASLPVIEEPNHLQHSPRDSSVC